MRFAIIGVCAALASCGQPTEQTRTLDERPAILVQGAPAAAILQVDGLAAGAVTSMSGSPQAIRIEPGTHTVAVLVNGKTIFTDRIFVSGAVTKTIAVPAGGATQ